MSRPAYKLSFSEPVAGEPDADPYEYGWRERREVAADGTETLTWDPLTYPDLLDPRARRTGRRPGR
ncbi:MAG TPA: hypothetical protein VGG06_09615 [Thermoanaerobaculia bacterium]|jgi:hypothetical protein